MSEFGIKIKNIVAGSIYECNIGVRDNLDMEDAMLSNSLLLDFLLKNGLNVWNSESTRDIIGVDFKYGSRSYDMEVKHLQKLLNEESITQEKFQELFNRVNSNRDKYHRITRDDLRVLYYNDGVSVTYNTYNRKGHVIKRETIHYKMLFRSPGKAKKGVCMFIRDSLYDDTINFMRMGIQMQDTNAPIVEMGAYSSLIASGIVGRVKIEPENVLVIPDVDSFMIRDAISVETNDKNQCIAELKRNYKLKNTMFDGQALIDSSIFPAWGDGYILLRQHMTKCAAFNTNIQDFFRDYYGDEYSSAVVNDFWGNPHNVKDIKMITTENAMKWMKFGVGYKYWCEWVKRNDSLWGIVKTSHKSKLGRMQRMSYQMINTLDMLTMDETLLPTKQYIYAMQTDDDVFLDYLRKNQNFFNDFEVLLAIVEQNRDFLQSEYFRERKRYIIHGYLMNVKTGRVIQNAENLTIVGSPYGMLMAAVGEDPERDPTFEQEDGAIQCFTKRFEDGEFLAAFRSPMNSKNNIDYLHNHYHEYFEKYFNFGEQIIAVNMAHSDFQDRSNGSDQDSDMVYTTNARAIVSHVKQCYRDYPTIVNNVPKEKNHYDNTPTDFAVVDNKLAKAQSAIGESSNLAQIALTYTYNFEDKKYNDAVCILSVLA